MFIKTSFDSKNQKLLFASDLQFKQDNAAENQSAGNLRGSSETIRKLSFDEIE